MVHFTKTSATPCFDEDKWEQKPDERMGEDNYYHFYCKETKSNLYIKRHHGNSSQVITLRANLHRDLILDIQSSMSLVSIDADFTPKVCYLKDSRKVLYTGEPIKLSIEQSLNVEETDSDLEILYESEELMDNKVVRFNSITLSGSKGVGVFVEESHNEPASVCFGDNNTKNIFYSLGDTNKHRSKELSVYNWTEGYACSFTPVIFFSYGYDSLVSPRSTNMQLSSMHDQSLFKVYFMNQKDGGTLYINDDASVRNEEATIYLYSSYPGEEGIGVLQTNEILNFMNLNMACYDQKTYAQKLIPVKELGDMLNPNSQLSLDGKVKIQGSYNGRFLSCVGISSLEVETECEINSSFNINNSEVKVFHDSCLDEKDIAIINAKGFINKDEVNIHSINKNAEVRFIDSKNSVSQIFHGFYDMKVDTKSILNTSIKAHYCNGSNIFIKDSSLQDCVIKLEKSRTASDIYITNSHLKGCDLSTDKGIRVIDSYMENQALSGKIELISHDDRIELEQDKKEPYKPVYEDAISKNQIDMSEY